MTSNIAYGYDGFGRLSSEAQDSYSVGYGYDAGHNLQTLTYPDNYVLTHSYDALDRLASVTDTGGTIGSYTYAGPGRIKTRTTGVTQTNVFDGLRRLTGIQAGVNLNLGYGYDDVDRRLYKQKNHQGGIGDVYGYDTASRLKDVWYDATNPPSGNTGFTGDFHVTQSLVDDRTQTTTNGTPTNYNAPDSLHRYTQIGAAARAYDTKGNLTDDGSQLFEFDPWNRLTKVKDKASGAERARYELDAVGRRVKKVETGLTTRYVYAGTRLLGEYEDTGGGPVFKRRYIYGSGMDEALALESAGQRYWMYQDALGSTEAITDLSNVLVERYSYDGFGQPTVKNGAGVPITGAYGRPASNLKNALWFTGARWDNESGHYHMRARQYEPGAGRFVSRDPLGYVDGPNAYAYGYSSPSNWIDPLGLSAAGGSGSGRARGWNGPEAIIWTHYADRQAAEGNDFIASLTDLPFNPLKHATHINARAFISGMGDKVADKLAGAAQLASSVNNLQSTLAKGGMDIGRRAWGFLTDSRPLIGPSPTASGRSSQDLRNQVVKLVQSVPQAAVDLVNAPFDMAADHVVDGVTAYVNEDSHALGFVLEDEAEIVVTLGASAAASGLKAAAPRLAALLGRSECLASKNGVVVIGEDMARVRDFASKIGGETFGGKSLEENRLWIQEVRAAGKQVIDIGPAFERRALRLSQGLRPDSPFYNVERMETAGYENYIKAFERTSKYTGGLPHER